MKKKYIIAAALGAVAGVGGYIFGRKQKGVVGKTNQQKNALVVTSVASMVDQFILPSIRLLIDLGYSVDVATNFVNGSTCTDEKIAELIEILNDMSVDCYHIDFDRKVMDVRADIRSFRQLDAVVCGNAKPINSTRHHHIGVENHYTLIHSHSPIGGVVGRITAKRYRIRSIYTAHGFHFYDGAPKKNWLIFYPIEWSLSWITDVLITINKEDYKMASDHLHAKKTVYIQGVGVDTKKFYSGVVDPEEKRKELEISEEVILLLSVGELIDRKNHEVVIRALPQLEDNIIYFIAGKGENEGKLKELARKLGVEKRMHFLGFRTDISELCQAADIFIFPSHQEGVSLALMEAIACKTPVLCSRIRGNTDLISDERYLFDENDVSDVVKSIRSITSNGRAEIEALTKEIVEMNYKNLRNFDLESVRPLLQNEFAEIWWRN